MPALTLICGLATLEAIGSSLLSVGAFGLTTAVNYAVSGMIDWTIAAIFLAGGVAGGTLGVQHGGKRRWITLQSGGGSRSKPALHHA